jgi:drug/metabolite transporter (DMT)-like permease
MGLASHFVTHLFLYFIALIFLSQSASMAKYAAAPPEVIGTWRMLIACLFFIGVSFFQGHGFKALRLNQAQTRKLPMTGLFFFLHLWTFFYASQNTLISHTMILFCLNPLFVALGRWWMTRELPSKSLALSYVLSFLALALLLFESQKSISSQQALWGDLSAFLSAVFFAVYFLLNHGVRQHLPNSVFSGWMYLSTAFCFFVTMALRQDNWLNYPTHTWLGIGAQILFPTLMGHALISYLMKHLDPTWMATGKLAEPILATVVAIYLFNESVSTQSVGAFLLTGLALILFFSSSKKARAASGDPRK